MCQYMTFCHLSHVPRLRLACAFLKFHQNCHVNDLNEKSYNKTVIDFNFGRHKDLSTLKSGIHLGLAASVNYHFFQ